MTGAEAGSPSAPARPPPRRGRGVRVLEQRPDVRGELRGLARPGHRGRAGAHRGRGVHENGSSGFCTVAPRRAGGSSATASRPSLSRRGVRNPALATAQRLVEPAPLAVLRRGQPAVERGDGDVDRLRERPRRRRGESCAACARSGGLPRAPADWASASTGGTSCPQRRRAEAARPSVELAEGVRGGTGTRGHRAASVTSASHRLGGHPSVVVAQERAQRRGVLGGDHVGERPWRRWPAPPHRRRGGRGAAPADSSAGFICPSA